jgi:hypothetical protein
VRRTAPAQVMSLCLRRAERETQPAVHVTGAVGSVRDAMHLRGLLIVVLGLTSAFFAL